MIETMLVSEKVSEITDELKRLNLWKQYEPDWVSDFEKKTINTGQDFLEWLQFVYLPNCKIHFGPAKKTFIVPQAIQFFGEDVNKGKLLQLLIELDSL